QNFLFARGYTGHEHLDEFGLINMNGRMYDPLLGRMLSPDNYVQAPDNSQNFNRYSYAMNNPLVYTDPDGELAWFVPMIIGAAYGGVQSYIQGSSAGLKGEDLAISTAKGSIAGAINGFFGSYASGTNFFNIPHVGALPGFAVGSLNGVVAGALSGAITGYAATGNIDGLWGGIKNGAMLGGITGGLSGSIGGYNSAKDLELNPLTGGSINAKLDLLLNVLGPHLESEMGEAGIVGYEVGTNKNFRHYNLPHRNSNGDMSIRGKLANGYTQRIPNGSGTFNNRIWISKNRVRQLFYYGSPMAVETLYHEYFHARDHFDGTFSRLWNSCYNSTDASADMITSILEFRAYQFNYSRTGFSIHLNRMNYHYIRSGLIILSF
ncbi:MAG: RHS repeat-associated core domain-containing protein, partial [Clostridia bacterium]|nr:RHS repeat-associated core domain-containing protein [Clostridia bacterium]